MTTEQSTCRPRLVSDRAGEPYSSWVRRASCAGQTAVFADESRSDDALAICGECVVRRQCRAWALANAVEGEPEPVVTVEDFLGADVASGDCTWGRGRSDAILNAVARWTDNGESGRQIALRLGVTRRTVNRLRARCRDRKLIA